MAAFAERWKWHGVATEVATAHCYRAAHVKVAAPLEPLLRKVALLCHIATDHELIQ